MIVYIMQARRTELSAVEVEGLPLWRLAVGGGFLARRRATGLLEKLYDGGTRRCVCPEGLRMLPLRAGITPVGALPFRRAVAGQLLDALCPEGLGDGCAVLRCGGSGEETARGLLPVLSSRARYVRLEGEGTASLARELMYRWGIAAGDGGRAAAVTVLCGEGCRAPEGRTLYLTGDCGRYQRWAWTAPRGEGAAVAVTEELAGVLLEAGKWEASDIHIISLLDIRGENHYNAT